MTAAAGRIWIALADPSARIDILELETGRAEANARSTGNTTTALCRLVGSFIGREPRLTALQVDRLVLVLREPQSEGGELLVARGIAPGATEWRPPGRVTSLALDDLELCGRLLLTSRGTLVLPTLWKTAQADSHEVRCFLSKDGGASWSDGSRLRNARGGEPTAAALGETKTAVVFGASADLVAHESMDDLSSSGTMLELPVAGQSSSCRIIRSATGLAIIWIEANADSMLAPPFVPSLRCAISADEGASWQPSRALPLRPGCTTELRAGVVYDGTLAFLVDQSCSMLHSFVCIGWNPPARGALRTTPIHSPYTQDSESARLALRVLATHTMERRSRSPRLFVEAYFMRALVAAAGALADEKSGGFTWFPPEMAVQRAVDWADSLVAMQGWNGFWKLGYPAEWYADMAAAVGLFPALEASVDTVRAGRYERAAARFLRGLERQNMIFSNGAVGIGRSFAINRHHMAGRTQREPYLVSTALAGIAVSAWLYKRTGEESYRDRALAALDYTLSQITDDGFAEAAARREGSLRVAAYVEEGWMAADKFLDDPDLRSRLHESLRPHVEWLLRVQRSDGAWDGGEPGGFARTPAIIDFLIWYDQAGEPRDDVRRAVVRASAAFHDPDSWRTWGLFRADEDHEVLRALAGRPLAALVSGRPVQ
jgi:hypothetical protein